MENKNKKVLVADDDPAILDSVSMLLEELGYSVETSVNGETIFKMQNDLPDILLLDIWMSGRDGRDICKKLKEQNHTKHIPIIMVSANKDTEKIARQAGADDFLAKPFDINELNQKIEKYTAKIN
jgi:CheY-like chemotaxis protein